MNLNLSKVHSKKNFYNPACATSCQVYGMNDMLPSPPAMTTLIFFEQGGDNPGNRNSYHPFYITDHPEGGYGLKVRAEQRLENIYAGVENLMPVGKGPRCEFMPKGGADKGQFPIE